MAERPAVLVTRPAGQARGLCSMLEQAGMQAVQVPALEIQPVLDEAGRAALTAAVARADLVVFVSPNAVEQALPVLLNAGAWPRQARIATVGPGTAAAIEAQGVCVDYLPEHEYSSEGLLALPALQHMSGRHVVILRGNGGRDTLYENLTARGAQVEYLEVYRRACPLQHAARLQQLLEAGTLQAVTVTSNESLQNLYAMAGEQGRERLLAIPLVIPGRRQAVLAARLGFRAGAVMAGHASDTAMTEAVRQLLAGQG